MDQHQHIVEIENKRKEGIKKMDLKKGGHLQSGVKPLMMKRGRKKWRKRGKKTDWIESSTLS